MKNYWDLTPEQQMQVARDPAVQAAATATLAAYAAATDAFDAARNKVIKRMFKKGKLK